MNRWAIWLAAAALAPALAGCGTGTGEVAGVVTLDGKPLPAAAVTFLAPSGEAFPVFTDEAGRYSVAGLPAGPCRASVCVEADGSGESSGEAGKKFTAAGTAPAARAAPALPDRYAHPDTSGLAVTVVAGTTTTFDIPLPKQ